METHSGGARGKKVGKYGKTRGGYFIRGGGTVEIERMFRVLTDRSN